MNNAVVSLAGRKMIFVIEISTQWSMFYLGIKLKTMNIHLKLLSIAHLFTSKYLNMIELWMNFSIKWY